MYARKVAINQGRMYARKKEMQAKKVARKHAGMCAKKVARNKVKSRPETWQGPRRESMQKVASN